MGLLPSTSRTSSNSPSMRARTSLPLALGRACATLTPDCTTLVAGLCRMECAQTWELVHISPSGDVVRQHDNGDSPWTISSR